jgi:hypothetical protein
MWSGLDAPASVMFRALLVKRKQIYMVSCIYNQEKDILLFVPFLPKKKDITSAEANGAKSSQPVATFRQMTQGFTWALTPLARKG